MSDLFKNKKKYAVSRLFDGERALIYQKNGKFGLKSDADYNLSKLNQIVPIQDFILEGYVVEDGEDTVFYATDLAYFEENMAEKPWPDRYKTLRSNFEFTEDFRLEQPIVITDRDETEAASELFSMLDHSKGAMFKPYDSGMKARPVTSEFAEEVDLKPTKEMKNVADKVLGWKEEGKVPDSCGTDVGWARANQLSNRENLSAETVGRMVSFFARHEKNKGVEEDEEPWTDCGHVMWLAWGGDPGKEWAERKQEQIERVEENQERPEDLPEDEPATPEAMIENPDYEFEPVPTQVVYASRARAMMRADDLGLNGVHEHEVDGQVMYMPGTTHQDWIDRLKGEK